MKNRTYDFRVIGRGDFPFDMLRYDSCYPVDSDSAAQLSFNFLAGEDEYHQFRTKNRIIKLRSQREPTSDRWSSFGWTVVNEMLFKGVSDDRILGLEPHKHMGTKW